MGCGGIGGTYLKPIGLSNVWNFYRVFQDLNLILKSLDGESNPALMPMNTFVLWFKLEPNFIKRELIALIEYKLNLIIL